jgi:hypothetical protein
LFTGRKRNRYLFLHALAFFSFANLFGNRIPITSHDGMILYRVGEFLLFFVRPEIAFLPGSKLYHLFLHAIASRPPPILLAIAFQPLSSQGFISL